MRIEVEKLSEAGLPFAGVYAPDELQLEDELTRLVSEAKLEGRASKWREQIRLRGKIKASVEVRCDRCITPVVFPVDADFDVTYVPEEVLTTEAEATELQEDDLTFATYAGDELDLDELAREQLLLALPLRHLCREDCKGLCLTCGEDLNTQACHCEQQEIDPRWAALSALKKNGNGES
ncbi:MAG TPA: DUF177 domain-containing protein [Pyrinomonadaceae bacterium]|jgi:uncharacterized protein|nr:DUF177 domain-containing protein [Pyrinomonadaceae bacterium]